MPLPESESPKIIREIFKLADLEPEIYMRNPNCFGSLKVDKLKFLTLLFAWIWGLEQPEKLQKKPMTEFLAQYCNNCERCPSIWVTPRVMKIADIFSSYVQLASQFNVTWMQRIRIEQPFYTPRDYIATSPQLVLSPLYQHFRVVGLFYQDILTEFEMILQLSSESMYYLGQYSSCKLLMYTLYEELGEDMIPSLRLLSTQAVIKAQGHPYLVYANGIAIKQDVLPYALAADRLVGPLPFDLTPATKLKSGNVFLDVYNLQLPPHGDYSGKQYYKLPYFVFYLARQLTVEELYSYLQKKKYLTSALFKKALALKNAFSDKEILEVAQSLDEDDIAQTSETLSLTSHLSMKRIVHPVRSSQCRHFNKVMDLEEFLQRVRAGYPMRCSICNEPCKFEQLFIDAFAEYCIMNDAVGGVEVFEDGTFELRTHQNEEKQENSGWF